MDLDDREFWETLSKQAEANLKQAEANCAISNTILSRTQRMVCNAGTAAIEPVRLESRYVAVSDAANVATTAGEIVEQANSLCVDSTQAFENADGKDASPERAAVYAVVAKPIVGTKRRVPSVLELLTAQGGSFSCS